MLARGLQILSLVYGVICIAGFIFFLVLQSYVQRVEILLATIALTMIVLEMGITIVTMIRHKWIHPTVNINDRRIRANAARQRLLSTIVNE